MAEAVVDTSPLVFLAAVDQLALLRLVAERVVVPLPVMEELLVRGPEDVTVRAILASAWIEVVESPYPSESLLAWDLGRGETSVLARARSVESAVVVVDDLQARRAAYSLALPLRGTLGTVLLAKKRGIIDRARPLLVQMKARGMFLSDAVLDVALREVGE